MLSGKFRRQRFGRNQEGHLAFGSRRQTNKVITCRENDTAEIGNAIDVFGDINKRLDAAGQIAYLTFERIDAEFEGVDLVLQFLFESEFRFEFFVDKTALSESRSDDAVYAGEELCAFCVIGALNFGERRLGIDGLLQALFEQSQRAALFGHLLFPCFERVDLAFGSVYATFDVGLELAVSLKERFVSLLQQVVVEHGYHVSFGGVDVALDRLPFGESGAESLQHRNGLSICLKRLVGCLREGIVVRLVYLAGDLLLHRLDLRLDGVDRFVAGRDLGV